MDGGREGLKLVWIELGRVDEGKKVEIGREGERDGGVDVVRAHLDNRSTCSLCKPQSTPHFITLFDQN